MLKTITGMNYNNTMEKVVTCPKGAKILIRGIRDPNVFNATVLVCPVHGDKIIVPVGMPKRKWEYVKVISQGLVALPWSSQYDRMVKAPKKPYTLP